MRLTIKITLNDHDEFDSVIMDDLQDKKNKGARIRRLLYDQLTRTGGGAIIAPQVPASAPLAEAVQVLTEKAKDKEIKETPEIKKKLASFG